MSIFLDVEVFHVMSNVGVVSYFAMRIKEL